MLIQRRSPRTGVVNSMELDITKEQLETWKNGTVIQKAMPNLNADEREFLITGLTSEDWNAIFGNDE